MEVEVREAPFDPGAELGAFDPRGGGAVVSFTGVVRGDGGLSLMEIEHWPGATEEAVAGIVERRHTLPILANVLIRKTGPQLQLTTSDLEIQIRTTADLGGDSGAFATTLGALTGNQALQQVKAGLKAIYLSGWQVAADANTAGQMYPDQSLYPVDSVPNVVRRINAALRKAAGLG